jgi:hypothetical protein
MRGRERGRSRRMYEGSITEVDLREVECESVKWTHLAQDRDQLRGLVKPVINLRVP